MKAYRVMLGAAAERDLMELAGYISFTLKEPAAAKRIYDAVKAKILSLNHMPDRHALVRDEHFARRGIRRLFAENYTVFYVIDEEARIVNILRVLYSRREWQNLLGE